MINECLYENKIRENILHLQLIKPRDRGQNSGQNSAIF